VQRFGFHTQPTTLVLTFSTALDPTSAEDVANYKLNEIHGKHVGRAIPIKAVVYDASAKTVTIEPAHRLSLFHHYRLLVNGSTPTGVKGATGLLLDGKGNGQPGSDYVATFEKEILAGPNVQTSRPDRLPHQHSVSAVTVVRRNHSTTSNTASSLHRLSVSSLNAVAQGKMSTSVQREHGHR
jgi:hypothetical protein